MDILMLGTVKCRAAYRDDDKDACEDAVHP